MADDDKKIEISIDENLQPVEEKPKKRTRRRTRKSKKDDKVTVDLGNGVTGKIDISSMDSFGEESG